jgi:hypothetical protein
MCVPPQLHCLRAKPHLLGVIRGKLRLAGDRDGGEPAQVDRRQAQIGAVPLVVLLDGLAGVDPQSRGKRDDHFCFHVVCLSVGARTNGACNHAHNLYKVRQARKTYIGNNTG